MLAKLGTVTFGLLKRMRRKLLGSGTSLASQGASGEKFARKLQRNLLY